MKENILKMRNMDKELIHLNLERNILVNGKMINIMEKGNLYFLISRR